MKIQDCYYEIYPKVLRVGVPCCVTLRPLYDHVTFKSDHTYTFELSERERYHKSPIVPEWTGETAVFSFTPESEQELILTMCDRWGEGREKKTQFHLYAVEADLVGLRPWKGDFHSHSCRSDGQESPLYVTSAYRRAGFDFHALTDHRLMPPSHEVIAGIRELDTDFKVYPGEEVHPPDSGVHHINFGGSFSVNDCHRDKESYEKAMAEYMAKEEFPSDLTEHERRWYACTLWVFDKIRESGGISLFCHPYWDWGAQYNVSEKLIDAIMKSRRFDAFELIGGYDTRTIEANYLQVNRWIEECISGNHMPVVGVSDSHGTEGLYFNWFYTLAFAPTCEFADLASAIRSERCVAVQQLPNESLQVYGRMRFVKYAYFLLREVLPLHHEECREEGRYMLKYFAGDQGAAEEVSRCKFRVRNLYDKLFA